MFRIVKKFRFEASHVLPGHDGKCRHLHGHTYHVEVECRGMQLHDDGPKRGMLSDFGDLKESMRSVLAVLDHAHLNDVNLLQNFSPTGPTGPSDWPPTAEIIAAAIYSCLEQTLPELSAVRVWETPDSMAEYKGQPWRMP